MEYHLKDLPAAAGVHTDKGCCPGNKLFPGCGAPAGYAGYETPASFKAPYRVHIVGLGDVGRNVALGLVLAGNGLIGRLGLFDLNEAQCRRMETELSQITYPLQGEQAQGLQSAMAFPDVVTVTEDSLFDCDLFLFCVAKAVPALGSGVSDVRMAQLEANAGIVSHYARLASGRGFRGLFCVISDPVDLLCAAALKASCSSNSSDSSNSGQECCGLHPDQIRGFGLGVMNARALYYARRDPRFALYETEGRAFGPHGSGLVIANSILPEHYDDAISRELTQKTSSANMEVRALGFKPFIAPAISSAALSVLAMLRGDWNYSASYLDGVYFGARSRGVFSSFEREDLLLPEALFDRLAASYRELAGLIGNL